MTFCNSGQPNILPKYFTNYMLFCNSVPAKYITQIVLPNITKYLTFCNSGPANPCRGPLWDVRTMPVQFTTPPASPEMFNQNGHLVISQILTLKAIMNIRTLTKTCQQRPSQWNRILFNIIEITVNLSHCVQSVPNDIYIFSKYIYFLQISVQGHI